MAKGVRQGNFRNSGLDSKLVRSESRSSMRQVRDIDDFDSPTLRNAYIEGQKAEMRKRSIRAMRKQGRVKNVFPQRATASDINKLASHFNNR